MLQKDKKNVVHAIPAVVCRTYNCAVIFTICYTRTIICLPFETFAYNCFSIVIRQTLCMQCLIVTLYLHIVDAITTTIYQTSSHIA